MSADGHGVAGSPIGDKIARQRFITKSMWFTIPGTLAVIWAAFRMVPPLPGMDDTSARISLALRWLAVAMIPYAAVCLHIAAARLIEGAHNPLLGQESERLKIHCRVMQNTLEQLAWFAICILALATYLTPAQARFIPVACTFFAVARLVFWWGYMRSGTLGRSPGVQLTFTLNVLLLVLALALGARSLAS